MELAECREHSHGDCGAEDTADYAMDNARLEHGFCAVTAGIHRHRHYSGRQRSNKGGHGGQGAQNHGASGVTAHGAAGNNGQGNQNCAYSPVVQQGGHDIADRIKSKPDNIAIINTA